MPESRHLTVPCSRCGRAAAEIALLPSSQTGETIWHDRDRLERTDFLGKVVKFGQWETLNEFFETLRQGDYAATWGDDADFVAFHCHTCGRVYCEQCWQVGSPVFDEGFYDYTLGTCPQGHEQVVDD
ncbi:MAG: hypothetical protein ACRDH2_10985 [Anaerolineales bacterium]